jgi:hypothetical protein
MKFQDLETNEAQKLIANAVASGVIRGLFFFSLLGFSGWVALLLIFRN